MLGVKEIELQEMDQRMSHRDVSLDEYVSEDGDTMHIDFLTYNGEDQETSLIKKEQVELVQRHLEGALAALSEKEQFIIKHRIMADEPMTLQEIGDHFHITRERARQLEKQALKKLRLALPFAGEELALPEK